MRRVVRETVKSFATLILGGLLAGCAWDNSPPPYHTVIRYDPSRSQTFLSNNPPTNAPSTRDWKTNQVVGVGYGSTGASAPAATGAAAGGIGAASSPSGISTGSGAGTTATGTGLAPLGAASSPPIPGFSTTSGLRVTNTGSTLSLTNTITGQTNLLPGLSRPSP